MDVYTYIAINNPDFAIQMCEKYGYDPVNVRRKSDLGNCLQRLVRVEGEGAFRDIMNGHPDKDVLVELYGVPTLPAIPTYTAADGSGNTLKCGSKCGCGGCNNRANNHYSNADGPTGERSAFSLTSVSIVAASLLLAVAIISRNK
jgi:hypothetical protein